MPYALIIFDVDGTLAEKYILTLLPGVAHFFRLAQSVDCPDRPKLAIATNQGGVGMRWWKEHTGQKDFSRYPTKAEIDQRMQALVRLLGGGIPYYAAFRFRSRTNHWTPPPPGTETDPRWSESWRKPNPGMLQAAMASAGAVPQQTLFVGDSPDDESAARAAGCAFAWAAEFFARPWNNCADLTAL